MTDMSVYRQLAADIGFPESEMMPEMFACIANEDEARVTQEDCTSCETCLERCFFDAISMAGPGDTAIIDGEKCMGCGICVPVCPDDAISYEEMRQKESIPG